MKVLTFLVKKYNEAFYGVYFFENNAKKSNLVVVVVLIVESKAGLEITAGQQTMSGLIGELTGQPFVLSVMLTGHI